MGKYVQAELPTDLWEWVDKTLQHGQKGQFIHDCFKNLRSLMEDGTLPPPSEYARAATAFTVINMVGMKEKKDEC